MNVSEQEMSDAISMLLHPERFYFQSDAFWLRLYTGLAMASVLGKIQMSPDDYATHDEMARHARFCAEVVLREVKRKEAKGREAKGKRVRQNIESPNGNKENERGRSDNSEGAAHES